jgi:hypothetical protein
MTTKQLTFKSLPAMAISDGATSPTLPPEIKGAFIYSTTLQKTLMWDGAKWTSAGLKGDKGDTGASGATAAVATTTVNGLMASTDKSKLDGIAPGANNFTYAHPANHPASIITQDASNRFVTDAEKGVWNSSSSDATTKANAAQAAAIAASAPAAHVGSGAAAHAVATTSVHGFMSSADKIKLDGVATGANNFTYAHPENHPASVITQDASNRFVTDAEKTAWNAKQNALGFTPVQQGGGANQGANKVYLRTSGKPSSQCYHSGRK